MRCISRQSWATDSADNWVLALGYFEHSQSFVCSSSDGGLRGYLLEQASPLFHIKAHESTINSLQVVDEYTVASCSTDGIKLWDLRTNSTTPVHILSNDRHSNFLSLDFRNNVLAGGTELVGADAEIHLWDLRNPGSLVRSFVDSHRDDITDLKFHPTIDNYLMSGSTDGFVNVYDLNEQDEDDALHQVITFSSVHSCHFTQERRIAVLSHMETLAFHDLNDTKYEENNENKPNDLGDIRTSLPDCEYVVDINPRGFISYGANTQRKLTLLPFNPITEQFDTSKPAWFPDAHGEEVVRDLLVLPNSKNALTCGEDGHIRLWELPYELQTYSFASSSPQDIIVDDEDVAAEEKEDKKQKKEKKEKKEKKDKKHKKDKKDKHGSKSDKKKKEKRFKPY